MSRKSGYTSKLAKEGGWTCEYCGLNFRTRRELQNHKKEAHYSSESGHVNQFTKAKILGEEKPNVSKETREKLGAAWKGRKHTEEQKRKISESMKKAHAEGRAHNIGECRWNNEPSYPERWFMEVLKNELNMELGKDYKREFPFHKFSLDFAWEDKKICVELDGEQHKRFKEQQERDEEKDRLLLEEGWLEIREDWVKIFHNPKEFIEKIKNILEQ